MNRADILYAANKAVMVDRAATHGEPEDTFAAIAGGWEWWLSSRKRGPLTEFDVACMMSIFKLARMAGNPSHNDSAVDLCGYGSIAGEIGARDVNSGGELSA